MAKQKKVRVEFLLQERRKPNEFGCYPIYIQLFYNRRYADFPLREPIYVENLEEYQRENPEIFGFEQRQLTSLMRFEEQRLGDKVTVKGIAAKYTLIHHDIYMVVNQYLNNHLFKMVIRQQPDHLVEIINMDNRISVFSFLEACDKLFENFKDGMSQSLIKSLNTFEKYLQACELPIHFDNRGVESSWEKRFTVMDFLSGYAQEKLSSDLVDDELLGLVKEVATWHLRDILGKQPFNI